MFIALAIFFFANFLFTVWKFKVLINPATLFALGFAVAAAMCLGYYDLWNLKTFRQDTFNVFFFGTLLYTVTCALLCPKESELKSHENIDNVPISKLYNINRFQVLMVLAILLQAYVCYFTYKFMVASYYSSWDFMTLAYEAHMDSREGMKIDMPRWVSWPSQLSSNATPFISLVMGVFIAKKQFRGINALLFIVYFFIAGITYALSATKGGFIQAIIIIILAWYIKFTRINPRLSLPLKKLAVIGAAGVIVVATIGFFNTALGRGDERDNTLSNSIYSGAVYCGAELKNLDVYMYHPHHSSKWGEITFRQYYASMEKYGITDYNETKNYIKDFLSIKGYFLGNVYTIFCDLYWDFGWWGLLWMPVMAFIAMFVYKRIFKSRKPLAQVSIWEYLYITMGWHIFMSFFSNRFFEAYCQPMAVIKTFIWFYLIDFMLRKFVYKPNPKEITTKTQNATI